jgi:glycosyltransferase 2 family protein
MLALGFSPSWYGQCHVTEALITGFAANFVLPARIGELFRADYAHHIFKMDRFTTFGTIVVERVCDGILLVCALWTSLALMLFMRFAFVATSWIFVVAAVSSALFGAALIFILLSQRIDFRRFGIMEGIATRWDRLLMGISSVLGTNMTAVLICSIGVLALDALTLASIVRSFGIILSPAETLMLLGLASLSTLVPTAPGYVGTYQLVFGNVFQIFGYPETIGIVAATAVQIFCFGTVTIIGGFVLLSRSGITVWRAHK